MDIRVVVILSDKETSELPRAIARFTSLGFTENPGDADGRRWLQIKGTATETDLAKIASLISH